MSARRACVVIAALVLAGCYRDFVIAPRPGADAGTVARDAGPPAPRPDAGWTEPIGVCSVPSGVDLIFVVDNSSSMSEEQESLGAQIPAMIEALVEPPDDDGDGLPDWAPIPDLRVAVITTDMGSGGHAVPTCDGGTFGARFGDDGILRTSGRPGAVGCPVTSPSIFAFAPGETVDAMELACTASPGNSGCGFEQPLEAALKALSPSAPASYTPPSYEPPIFAEGTLGHGDREHDGFVRDDTLLVVVIVTDEDDCSIRTPELLDPSSTTYVGDLNLRCFTYPEAVHPVERYVGGLTALRARRPDLLALAVIAGIPVETAVALPRATDFEAMLDHPAMVERIDPAEPTRLLTSCEAAGLGSAFPPRRLVRAAAGLGEGRATVQSICQSDFGPAVAPIVQLITRRACQGREVL